MFVKNNSRKVWILLTWVIIATLLLSGCGKAQLSKEVYHVGIIFTRTGYDDIANAFKAKLAEMGYVEGTDIVYDLQTANAETNPAKSIAEKFMTDKVDLILTCGTGASVAAKEATQGTNIPVVFTFTTIEGIDLVQSVSAPGGNVTGVRYPGPELTSKRFEILRQIIPSLKRLYVTYQADNPTSQSAIEALRPAAQTAGVTLVEEHITKVEDIVANLDARANAEDIGMDAILILPDTLSQSSAGWAAINKFAADHNLPVAGNAISQAQDGAVFSYAPAYSENGMQAALLADKIFQQELSAGTIPVVTPDSQLLLNYKVAQSLGLVIPEGLIKQAAEIIR